MEKSPLTSLKEWEELLEYVREQHSSHLVTPENSLNIAIDSCKDSLNRTQTIAARWSLNGFSRDAQVEFDYVMATIDPLTRNPVDDLVDKITDPLKVELKGEIYKKLIANDHYEPGAYRA